MDIDLIRVQDTILIRKDVVGLSPYTEYRFRLALLRVFEERLFETIDITGVTIARTGCTGTDTTNFEKCLC